MPELKSIALEYLFDGMVLAEDIYNHAGKLLLLSKGNILTKDKLEKLKAINANNRNISVFESTFNNLIEHGISSEAALMQNNLENKIGYSKIKESTSGLFSSANNGKIITQAETNIIANDISETLKTTDLATILQCLNSPKPVDEYLRRHSVNVGIINGLIGKWLNLPQKDIDQLVLAGLVHDVGKTKIPSEILDAPRALSLSEFEVMKMHTIYSYELLSQDASFAEPVKLAARHHHEKINGSGYPDKINGNQISLFARITAVSDIYDAMVSKRSYKTGDNPFTIIAKLSNQRFSELDTSLIKLFTERMPSELVGKPVLLSNGTVGTIRFIIPNDLEHPLVEVNGLVTQTNNNIYCTRMISEG